MENKLVLKVTTDSKGNQLRLDSMSIEAAKAFLVLYEALVQLVELTDTHKDARISITQSSLATSVSGTMTVNHLVNDFNRVLDSECDDAEKVKQWRIIQEQIQRNGLGYDIVYYKGDITESFYTKIKQAKAFTKKRTRNKYSSSIRFITGNLIDAGGRHKSNIHLIVPGGDEITVGCSQMDAKHAATYLYTSINISVWQKKDSSGNNLYELCDVYFEDELDLYDEFKQFFDSLTDKEELEGLTMIHRLVKSYLIEKNFKKLGKISQLWIHPTTDIQTLKTVLVLTNAFEDDIRFSKERTKMLELYNTRFAKEMKLLKKKRKAPNGI